MEYLYLKKEIEKNSCDFSIFIDALNNTRDDLLNMIIKSNLLGRGGAGFPTGKKWSFVKDKNDVIFICNADEGEPGTFKDRYILENNPDYFLQSILISAYILNSAEIYIYIRGEYLKAITNMKNSMLKNKKYIDILSEKLKKQVEITIVEGAGAYICGDETSLINSIEGKRPNSRIKPPYPADKGLFNNPTIVNNVETIANIPLIIRDKENYLKIGTENSRGTKLISLSGAINKPGVYEIELGKITFRDLIYNLGEGIRNNNKFKFLIPGGISTEILVESELDTIISHDSLKKASSALGSGAVIVADDKVDILDVAINTADFYMHETCGTCFPCKEGNRQIHYLLEKLKEGKGKKEWFEIINDIEKTTTNAARCGLGQSVGKLISSSMKKLAHEYNKYIVG
ncbi:MAG: NADH-quinone oxidoreductase subunit [Fusobacteriaceae bacterium]|jgi:NADH-quinone oxidoreductase subunit F|nr:dehydrogenase FAD-containing subunit [Fusobacteriales bacterium]MDN5304766.1 NADH-quinone oxidoreductase subunit [Fusobacteriaceae bacterium]